MQDRHPSVPRFDSSFLRSDHAFARIGDGSLGGKALGLLFAKSVLDFEFDRDRFPGLEIGIPRSIIIATDTFDSFIGDNALADIVYSDSEDDTIARACQDAALPANLLDHLRLLAEGIDGPIAVRSSSLLEDALLHPLAGVYDTKMIPNRGALDERAHQLEEAVKYVYGTTFRRTAKTYLLATGHDIRKEKMAVLIQAVVGDPYGDHFYPNISGVGRSYNFYPFGPATPGDGVVSLALGLGKTIVDGGVCWSFSPAHPKAPPPFGSLNDMLKNTQLKFWSICFTPPERHNPVDGTEYMVERDLTSAEAEGTLAGIASTLDAESGRLVMGTGRHGPRVLDFAPLLQLGDIPVNGAVRAILDAFEREMGTAVELEFVVAQLASSAPRFALVQMRPMAVANEFVQIDPNDLEGRRVLVECDLVVGNGRADIHDVVYVRPDTFEPQHSARIPEQLEQLNRSLLDEDRPYLLIGFGRWGSSDPSLGIPVTWGQISGARAIVEGEWPSRRIDPSQGSHFFHNLSSFGTLYFCAHDAERSPMDWEWLRAQPTISETNHVRHVRSNDLISVKVDGRSRRGVIVV